MSIELSKVDLAEWELDKLNKIDHPSSVWFAKTIQNLARRYGIGAKASYLAFRGLLDYAEKAIIKADGERVLRVLSECADEALAQEDSEEEKTH